MLSSSKITNHEPIAMANNDKRKNGEGEEKKNLADNDILNESLSAEFLLLHHHHHHHHHRQASSHVY
jgi:hypothetical protein